MGKTEVFFRKGNRVILRPILKEDVEQLFIWMNDPEITQYLLRNVPFSLEEEHRWFERATTLNEKSFTLAIVDREQNRLIGCMGIHDIDYRFGTAITGSVIGNKEYWGKGYGSEAKMLLLQFAFHELNLRKIYSHVVDYNLRSAAYSKKCGYVEEARIPKHYYKNGAYRDQIILAVYRSPWEKLWKKFLKQLKNR